MVRHNKLSLFVHLVWTTWDRLPLITTEIERRLHGHLESHAVREGCKIIALNGVADHVHLLVEVPPTLSISKLVKDLKGVSSHFVNETLRPEVPFRWQASYGAFTVSRWDVKHVAGYINRQKEHHAAGGKLITRLEACE